MQKKKKSEVSEGGRGSFEMLEIVSRCTSCTEGHARADADILWCIPCANWTTSPKQAGNKQRGIGTKWAV